MPAINASKQSALDWRREPTAVFLNEDITDCTLRDLIAQIHEEHIVVASLRRLQIFQSIEWALRGLVVKHHICGVRSRGGDAHSADSVRVGGWGKRFAPDLDVAFAVDH